MTKQKRKQKNTALWVLAAFIFSLFMAPNSTVIRSVLNSTDPFLWMSLRFGLIAVICLPFVVIYWKTLRKKSVRKWIVLAIASMTVTMLCYTLAIEQSQASYVSIIMLISPIMLVLLAGFFTKDRINKRAVTGVTLAAIGAMAIILLPLALSQDGVGFYPTATVLALINSIGFSIVIISLRKIDEHSVPMAVIIGLSSAATSALATIIFLVSGGTMQIPTEYSFWAAALYSGIGVALIGRMISIILFEKNGAALTSAMNYFQTFLAVLLPAFVLGEKISVWMILGGMLILSGVYIIEHHKKPHAKHHFVWWHH